MPSPARKKLNYEISLPAFDGPLDLLLHLVERDELDITVISLARVTDQYLAQVEHLQQDKIDHLIDFLVVAARLVLIKSRALLPSPPSAAADAEEEDPADALIRQLRQYRQFKQAAAWLQARNQQGLRTYLRVAPPPRLEAKPDLSDLTLAALTAALRQVLARAEQQQESVEVVQPRRITIEGQLRHLRYTLQRERRLDFRALLTPEADAVEVAVTLLATLELIKREEIVAHQTHLFGPIELVATEMGADGEPAPQSTAATPAP